ncbi:MAG TPA: hypothetical protein PL137_07425 [Nocardioides sp.]|nr:hypothetical protein [Nocardioides sp.]
MLDEDQVGVLDLGGLLDGQLEVVGLGARLREVGDRHVVAADPLGHEGERIERRRDRDPSPVRRVVGERRAAGRGHEHQGEES